MGHIKMVPGGAVMSVHHVERQCRPSFLICSLQRWSSTLCRPLLIQSQKISNAGVRCSGLSGFCMHTLSCAYRSCQFGQHTLTWQQTLSPSIPP